MVSKKEFIKKWKEVKELHLPTMQYVQENTVVTLNELDKGLTKTEQAYLDKGKFPEVLYKIDGRVDALYARFEEMIETRASPHIMVNQLIHNIKTGHTLMTLATELWSNTPASLEAPVNATADEIKQLAHSTYKTLYAVSRRADRKIISVDLHDALREYWYMNVRIPMQDALQKEAQEEAKNKPKEVWVDDDKGIADTVEGTIKDEMDEVNLPLLSIEDINELLRENIAFMFTESRLKFKVERVEKELNESIQNTHELMKENRKLRKELKSIKKAMKVYGKLTK